MAFNNSSSQNIGIFTLEEYALNIPVLFFHYSLCESNERTLRMLLSFVRIEQGLINKMWVYQYAKQKTDCY